MFISNLTATLYKGDTKVLYFSIQNKKLVEYTVFDHNSLPASLRKIGISYFTINDFFKYRVCMDGCMGIDEYLHDLGLRVYDFEQIVKRLQGRNEIDSYHLEDIKD